MSPVEVILLLLVFDLWHCSLSSDVSLSANAFLDDDEGSILTVISSFHTPSDGPMTRKLSYYSVQCLDRNESSQDEGRCCQAINHAFSSLLGTTRSLEIICLVDDDNDVENRRDDHRERVVLKLFPVILDEWNNKQHKLQWMTTQFSMWTATLILPLPDLDDAFNDSPSWTHFVWNEENRTGTLVDLNALEHSEIAIDQPLQFLLSYPPKPWLKPYNSQEATSFQNTPMENYDHVQQHFSSIPPFFHLTSSLSDYGGMHRRLHHTLQLKQSSSSSRCEKHQLHIPFSFSIAILVPIPSQFFIDVENAYEIQNPSNDPQESWKIELIVMPNQKNTRALINIEEPAFVSPSHVVLYSVHGTSILSCNHDDHNHQKPPWIVHREFQWDSLLHLRYLEPWKPTSQDESISSSPPWRWVTLPSPWIVRVEYQYNPLVSDPPLQLQADRISFWVLLPPQDPPISLLVAAGYAQDLIPVLVLTWSVSLGGMIVLMRALRNVGRQ